MEELLHSLIKDNFKDLTKLTIWINIGVIAFTVLINFGVTHHFKSLIEKVKLKNSKEVSEFKASLNVITKIAEIKFQEYHLEQTKVIKEAYSMLVELEYLTETLFSSNFNGDHHVEYKNRLFKWGMYYSKFHKFFSKNRIIFDQNLLSLTEEHISVLHNIYSVIFKDFKDIESLEDSVRGELDEWYVDEYIRENEINERLRKLKIEIDGRKEVLLKLKDNLTIEYKRLLA